MSDCRNLVDVSPLHGVYDLSLIQCEEVSDISSLGGHHRLEVTSCGLKVSGYDALENISIVKLCRCDISDVSVLSNSKVVHLQDCHEVVDVSPLRFVTELTLNNCSAFEDISILTTVKKLTLYSLRNLKNYEGINQITDLSLKVNNFKDGLLDKFPNAKKITCSDLPPEKIFPLLPSFTNLHTLTIRCAGPVIIEFCLDIHTVIFDCCSVENISGLGKNRVVRLFQCHGIVLDVTSLITVPIVSIIQCRFKKTNYDCLKNVPRLKID